MEKKNCSQDNFRLEKTICNTPKYLRSKEIRRFWACRGNPRDYCRHGTLTQFHERVASGQTRIYNFKHHMQKKWRIQVWCSAEADASFHCLSVHQKDQQELIFKIVDSRSLPNNSRLRTMPKTIHEFVVRGFLTKTPVSHCIYTRRWRCVTLGLALASCEDKGYVDLPLQSTSSRPPQCVCNGERHYLHNFRKPNKIH